MSINLPVITALIDFVLWSMGKVPYGPLCWIIPLIIGLIIDYVSKYCDFS